MNKHRIGPTRSLLVATIVALTCACGGEPESPVANARTLPLNVVATVELASGVTVRFIEPHPGEIIIDTLARLSSELEKVVAQTHGRQPVTVFERLANRKAPAALVAAQQRLATTAQTTQGALRPPAPISVYERPATLSPKKSTSSSTSSADKVGKQTQAIAWTTSWNEAHNASSFFNQWCTYTQNNSTYDFHLCWLNAVGTGSTMRYVDAMGIYIATEIGTSRVRYFGWEYNWGKVKWEWVQYFNVTTPAGMMRHVSSYGYGRWRYVESSLASAGSRYHATIYGQD